MRYETVRPPPLTPVTPPPSFSSASPTTRVSNRSSLPCVKDFFTESYKANSRNEDRYLIDTSSEEYHLFGVFDGHGGTECSKYIEQNIADFIRKERNNCEGTADWPVILSNALISLDTLFIKLHAKTYPTKGSCVIICIITHDRVYTACVGDSRAVLCRRKASDSPIEALPLSEDQDCKNQKEVIAVKNRTTDPTPIRCGKDQLSLRVAGTLMVTRALGDSYLKNPFHSFPPYVGHLPYITSAPIVSEHAFQRDTDVSIVLGSDGLYNLLPNDEIARIVTEHDLTPAKELLSSSLQKVAESQGITVRMLKQKQCGPRRRCIHDDITILVIHLGSNEIIDTMKSCIMCSDTTNQEMEMRSRTSSPQPDTNDWMTARESSCISLPEISESAEEDEPADDTLSLSQQSKASTGSGRTEYQTPKATTKAGAGTSSFLKAMARRRSNKSASASPPPRMPLSSPALPQQPETPTAVSTVKRAATDIILSKDVKRTKPETPVWKPPLKQSKRRITEGDKK